MKSRKRSHRFRRRKLRIPRAKTRIVRCMFETENLRAARLLPSTSTLETTYSTYQSDLPCYSGSLGGTNNAVTYAITFPLSFLVGQPGNYQYVSQLYDYVKLYKVKVNLKSAIDPRKAVTVVNQTTEPYSFNAWPLQDPVITWVDYDGFFCPPVVGGSGGVVGCPANGDYTQFVQNRAGTRRHNPWKGVKRTFYPKVILLVATDASNTGPQGSPSIMQGKRMGWMCNNNANLFTGQLMVAIPYLGQDSSTHLNFQPNFQYTITNRWYIGFKSPLYG